MPPQIGQFISTAVYEDKLKSNPSHPIKDDVIACRFIDAKGGESRLGDSYQVGKPYACFPLLTMVQNRMECDVAMKLAVKLQELEKSYRIITPYTAQRQLIEDSMKQVPDLLWGDKCFSVDSFQGPSLSFLCMFLVLTLWKGNEDDYIIISTVRSLQIGFLKNLRRTNVMLTRCKKGMFIISSQKFLAGPGACSLVGEMAKSAGAVAWLDVAEIEAGEFLT
jgi:superfamily I DNA and/or RNA helicase